MNNHEMNLVRRAKRQFFLDELDHRKTKQGRFEASFVHLDHPLMAGSRALEASDEGSGVNKVIAKCEETPLWLKLWRNKCKLLTSRQRLVLNALQVDLRPRVAARIAGVSKNFVYECLRKIFKVHFAQCYQAYRALLDG